MGAGFAGGLCVAAWIIDKNRKKFMTGHTYFYDKNGKPIPFPERKKNGTKTN